MIERRYPDAWGTVLPARFSASQAKQASRCLEEYRLNYVIGRRPQQKSIFLVWGTADHEAANLNFRQKINTGADLPVSDVQDAFRSSVRAQVEGSDNFDIDWGDVTPGHLIDHGAMMVAAYHTLVAPTVQPTRVEAEFQVELDGLPPIRGFIDVETESTIIDRKTSSRMTRTVKPEWRLQSNLYQLAVPKPCEWHVVTRTKTPGVYASHMDGFDGLRWEYDAHRSSMAVLRLRELVSSIEQSLEVYGPDHPWPTTAPDTGWNDDYCGRCDFRSQCEWWNKQ
jgi:hypothetical protein